MNTRHLSTAVGLGLLLVLIFIGAAREAGAVLNQPVSADPSFEQQIDVPYAPAVTDAHTWYTETVDSGTNLGWFTSLAVDYYGMVHISYIDLNQGYLKYADSLSHNLWHVETLDEMGGFNGGATSLSVTDDDFIMLSYHDGNRDRLNLATSVAGFNWLTETLFTSAGADNDLVLDKRDPENVIPHISYYDRIKNDLVYASQDASGKWYTTTIDSVGDVGQYPSIALSNLGEPQISYYDADGKNLKLARKYEGTWYVETVDDSPNDVGMDSSLAVDFFGVQHISYYDYTKGNLLYARWDTSSPQWITETVDSSGDVGAHTSLALDSTEQPHISYYDNTNDQLNYAYLSGSSWYTETVDSNGGWFSSLDLDKNDRPHISYLDGSSSRLLYATTFRRQAYFVVDDSYDGLDAKDTNPGDGVCKDAHGHCTLRAALEETNAWGSAEGTYIHLGREMTITIDSQAGALPAIKNERVLINALWDHDNDRSLVTIDGDNGSFDGLRLESDQCRIFGLQIQNFDGAAILINSADNVIGFSRPDGRNVLSGNTYGIQISGSSARNNLVMSNYIGTTPDGYTYQPNLVGVYIGEGASDNIIGGDTSDKGNLISGNTALAVKITGSGSDSNQLGGNIIGMNVDQNVSLPNGAGVQIDNGAAGNMIGGISLASNVIMFNQSIGVNLIEAGDNTEIYSNTISFNNDSGVEIYATDSSLVHWNTIANNMDYGVRLTGESAVNNTLVGNSIYYNLSKGILLDGANHELAAPTIISATESGANGSSCPSCIVELFSDYEDEGRYYHGSTQADASGAWNFPVNLRGPNITATATDADGSTSEFSTPYEDILDGTCQTPFQISCGQSVDGNTLGHNSNLDAYDCSLAGLSPEVVYNFTLPSGGSYTVTASITKTQNLEVLLLSDCSNGVCLSPDASGFEGKPAVVSNLPGGIYYLVVDANGPVLEDDYQVALDCTQSGFDVLLPLVQLGSP